MIRKILMMAIAVLAFSACTQLTSEQEKLLAQAQQIQHFPVKREKLIKMLELGHLSSERIDGGMRGGTMSFMESWKHPSGLEVSAFDSEYVGHMSITRKSIDEILNNPNRKNTDFILPTHIGPVRSKFNGFEIHKGEKVLFRSSENHNNKAAIGPSSP